MSRLLAFPGTSHQPRPLARRARTTVPPSRVAQKLARLEALNPYVTVVVEKLVDDLLVEITRRTR